MTTKLHRKRAEPEAITGADMQDLFDLSGRVAVVTGGGRGIGLMASRGLLQAGARVYIASRDGAACSAAAEDLSTVGPVVAMQADLSDPGACQEFASRVATREERIDILVNNAGATWGESIDKFPIAGWDKVMDLNLKSPFFLTQAFLPMLEAAASIHDPARIINIGSIDGIRVPTLPTYSYSASKAGLHHLTRALAVELGPRGITVNAIAPGPFESKMMDSTLRESKADFERFAPMQRIGRPDDIAAAVVYLCGRGTSYVTGVVFPVDGGLSLVSPR